MTERERPKTWEEIAARCKALGLHYPSGGENIGSLVIDLLLRVEQAEREVRGTK